MSQCSRCYVEDLIVKYRKENVAEFKVSDNRFHIFVRKPTTQKYVFVACIFSFKHSMDEDCYGDKEKGFPNVVTSPLNISAPKKEIVDV